MKWKEPPFMESFEINYVPRDGACLIVTKYVMNNQCQIGIPSNISTYQCCVNILTGKLIVCYTILLLLNVGKD